MWAITHRYQFCFKKKKNQVVSPSPESRVLKTGSDPPIGSGRDSGRDSSSSQSNPCFPNQNFPSQIFQNQGFSNQAPHFQNQGPQGFSANPSQCFHPFPQGNQNHQPYQPPHKRNLEDIIAKFVQSQQSTNTEFRTAINDVKSQITKLTASMGSSQQEKGKFPSQPIQNPPQCQNIIGTSSQNDGTFEHCKTITTLRNGKTIDKTINPKDLAK